MSAHESTDHLCFPVYLFSIVPKFGIRISVILISDWEFNCLSYLIFFFYPVGYPNSILKKLFTFRKPFLYLLR